MMKRGVTLIELMIVLLVSGIVVFAVATQFVSVTYFRNMIEDQSVVTTEANMAMHNMTKILRYAKSSMPVTVTNNSSVTSLEATISGDGYLDGITSDKKVIFTHNKASGEFIYQLDISGTPRVIAKYISSFAPAYDGVNELLLKITAKKNIRSSSLESKVHFLGK
ncbi:MAG: type II secretion system protein [Candidatus Omnitrophota bacterium]